MEGTQIIISDEVEQNQPYEIKSSVSAWVVIHKDNGENYLLVEFEGQTYLARVFTAATVEEQQKEENKLTGNYLADKMILSHMDIPELLALKTTSKYAAELVDNYIKQDLKDKRYLYYKNAKQFKPAEISDKEWLDLLEKFKVNEKVIPTEFPSVIYINPESARKDLGVKPSTPDFGGILSDTTIKQLASFKYPIYLYKMIEDASPGYLKEYTEDALFDMLLTNARFDPKKIYLKDPNVFDNLNEILNYLLNLGILPRSSYPEDLSIISSSLDVLAYYGDIEMLDKLANIDPPVLIGSLRYNMGRPSQEYNNWVRTVPREKVDAWLASLPPNMRGDPSELIGQFLLPIY